MHFQLALVCAALGVFNGATPVHHPAPLAAAEADIVELATDAGQFGTLLTAANAAGLVEALKGPGPLTVLAPTDAAFAKLDQKTLAALLEPENKEQLARILKYHVISGRVLAQDAVKAGTAETLADESLQFRITDGRLFAGTARVVTNDLLASNGVVHVIDSVLLPPNPTPQGTLVIGYNSGAPSAALAYQLGIDGHASTVVTAVNRAESGLQRYDVITHINGEPYSQTGITAAKRSAGFGGTIDLTIIRRCETRHLAVPVGIDPH